MFREGLPWGDVLKTMEISFRQGDFDQYIHLNLLSDSKMLISIKAANVQNYKSLQAPSSHLYLILLLTGILSI